MKRGFKMNVVTLLGRLTKDVELTYVGKKGETALGKFTLAIQDPYDKDRADFIRCTIFNAPAETLAEYTQKGDKLCVTGAIRTGSYENEDGDTVYTTDVIVSRFDFVESKKDDEEEDKPKKGKKTKKGKK